MSVLHWILMSQVDFSQVLLQVPNGIWVQYATCSDTPQKVVSEKSCKVFTDICRLGEYCRCSMFIKGVTLEIHTFLFGELYSCLVKLTQLFDTPDMSVRLYQF
ncbi:hypothetical protein ILYODFUR_029500 [Ilyodon furcidens]|uniref:Uncharacterized protein n=1 Tax=Ilyodon furcidens TaxID=33524 RepID=A0ABV0U9H7_9TELE